MEIGNRVVTGKSSRAVTRRAGLQNRLALKGSFVALAAAAALVGRSADAATYTYTPVANTNATADQWNAGTNWDSAPVSNASTVLSFSNNATTLPGGFLNYNTNNLGTFQLLTLNLNGTGPATGGVATINITGSTLAFQGGGSINLNAVQGVGFTYNIATPITLNGGGLTINRTGSAALNFTGTGIDLNSQTLTIGTGTLSFAQNITSTGGGGNITINSAGRVTLTGTNTFQGVLTVNGVLDSNGVGIAQSSAGSIAFGSGTTWGVSSTITTAKAISLAGGLDFYSNGNNFNFSGAFTEASGVATEHGSGTVTLSGTANNTGLALITNDGSVLNLNKTSSSTVHAVNTSLQVNSGSVVLGGSGGDQIADTASVTIGSASTFNLNGFSETIGSLASSGSTASVTNNGVSAPATLTVGGANSNTSFLGVISNGTSQLSFTKIGTGTQTLGGANTYTGVTSVNGGTLKLDFTQTGAPTTNIVSSSSALVLGGGTLSVLGPNTATTSSQTFNGTTFNAGASAITDTSGTGETLNLVLGAITRNIGSTVNFTLPTSGTIATTTANANFTGGQQTILGGYAVVGSAGWAVSGSGATAGNITALGTYNSGFAAGTDVDVASGASAPAAMTVNSIRFNAAGAATVNTSGNLVVATGGILVTNTVAGNGVSINNNTITSGNGTDLIVNQYNANAGGTATISSAIVNNGGTSIGLTKSGTGALNLTGANTYTGATTLNGGTTTVTATSALGNGSAVTLKGTSTLAFSNPTTVTLPTSAAAWGSENDWRGTPSNLGNGSTYQVGSVGGDTSKTDFIVVDLGANYNLSSIQYTIANSFQTLQYYIANSSAGPFSSLYTVNGHSTASPSTLNLAAFTADSAVIGTSGVNYAGGVQSFGLNGISGEYLAINITKRVSNGYGLDLSNLVLTQTIQDVTQTIGSLTGDSTSSVTLGNQVTLNTGSDNTSTTFAGAASGNGAITKAGSGNFKLSGANTYTGATTVAGGTLTVNGSLASSSAVSVSSGATLAGKGTAAGSVNIANGGHIAAGDGGIGTLTVGSLTLNSTSQLDFDLGAPGTSNAAPGTSDLIVDGGALTLAGTLNISNAGGFGAGIYQLFSYGGSLNGSLAAPINGTIASYYAYTIDTSVSGKVFLDVTATPEPTSLAIIGLGAAGLLARRKRNRASYLNV